MAAFKQYKGIWMVLCFFIGIAFVLNSVAVIDRYTFSKLLNSVKLKQRNATDIERHIQGKTLGKFHVVITFPLYKNTRHKNQTTLDKVRSSRMKEYLQVLTSFINNTNVKEVHLLHEEPEMPEYIQRERGLHPKLFFQKVVNATVVLTLHQFVFQHLLGKMVLISNADIYLGEGFEKVNESYVRKQKMMYALSRSVWKNPKCVAGQDQCAHYVGSHDTFVFVPLGKLEGRAASLLQHHFYQWGTENVIMYVYSKLLGYRLNNPCKLLRIYHSHCTNYRNVKDNRRRVNVGGITAFRKPTQSLKL